MKKVVTFKVELEVKVEYNVPEGLSTYPYTHFMTYTKNNEIHLGADKGTILDADFVKSVDSVKIEDK